MPRRRALSAIQLAVGLLVASCVLLVTRPAQAYPWMIRHGYGGCTTCHADPSGGELLTKYGRVQGDLLLRMHWSKDAPAAGAGHGSDDTSTFDEFDDFDGASTGSSNPNAPGENTSSRTTKAVEPSETDDEAARTGFLWGLWDTPDALLLGGSLRLAAFSVSGRVFPMQGDLYGQVTVWRIRAGGSIGVAKVKPNSANGRAAFVTTNQGDALNLLSRTHWLGFDMGAQHEWVVRAGRLNLPFGLRIPEHFMWVRDSTRTDRDSDQQHGVAIAYGGQSVRGEVMGIAGNYQVNPDRYRERGYSGYAELSVTPGATVGLSSLVTVAQADRVSLEQSATTRGAHGAFTRLVLAEPLVLLAEADTLHTSRRKLGYVGMVQADYELTQGLHLIGSGEILDTGYREPASNVDVPKVAGVGKPRFGGWVSLDWFFLPQLELRVDLLGRQDSGGAALAQLHAYL